MKKSNINKDWNQIVLQLIENKYKNKIIVVLLFIKCFVDYLKFSHFNELGFEHSFTHFIHFLNECILLLLWYYLLNCLFWLNSFFKTSSDISLYYLIFNFFIFLLICLSHSTFWIIFNLWNPKMILMFGNSFLCSICFLSIFFKNKQSFTEKTWKLHLNINNILLMSMNIVIIIEGILQNNR